ncbi:Gfo/Idh/MocA family protein [Caulobacter sp. KR2-114]|uniref:Gfo/Idh/MocA family protein n=1 Tax=Caulobacter sp. KR2-114 TaxID=3400912 RepID=UPI003C0ADAD3
MSQVLRVGVVGAGVFGGYHAAKYAAMPGVVLAGVFDPHPERAEALATRRGGAAFDSLEALLEASDAVSIASPASAHAGAALAALRAGRHVYVEKPIATDLADADAILGEAARRGRVVACGFLERAMFRGMGLFSIRERPLRLEAVRLGPTSPRNLDVSVVLDLMIHDLDLALAVTDAEPLAVEADGRSPVHDRLDEAEAEVNFDDGFIAVLRASRIAAERERRMTLVYPSGEISVDFVARTFSNTTGHPLTPAFRDPRADPLGESLAAFVAAVRGEAPSPLANALDGAKALDLALAVEQAVGR